MGDTRERTYKALKHARVFQSLLTAQKEKLLKRAENIFKSVYQNISKLDQAEVCASKVLDHFENQILTQDADCSSEQVERVDNAFVGEYANLADVGKRHAKYLHIDEIMGSHRQSLRATMDMARECLDTCESGKDSLHVSVAMPLTSWYRGDARIREVQE